MSEAAHFNADDRQAINDLLMGDLEGFATHFLGPPNRDSRSKRNWRWGRKSKFSLAVRGAKRGSFYSFEAGAGGSLFDLIMQAMQCPYREALQHAAEYAGYQRVALTDADRARLSATREKARLEAARQAEISAAEAEKETERGIKAAVNIWARGVPVSGTPAERYLSHFRCIPTPPGGWPVELIRFDPKESALLIPGRRPDTGDLTAVQQIFVAPDGSKAPESQWRPLNKMAQKQSRGSLSGSTFMLPPAALKDPDFAGMTAIAEGPETALTVWAATGMPVLGALGVISNVPVPDGASIVLCRDDDPADSPAYMQARNYLKALQHAGKTVVEAHPWPTRRRDKSDLNDTAQALGIDAVVERIRSAVASVRFAPIIKRVPIAEARAMARKVADNFKHAAHEWNAAFPAGYHQTIGKEEAAAEEEGRAPQYPPMPPAHIARIEVGVGKSHAAREMAVTAAMEMGLGPDEKDYRSITFFTPTLDLAEEQAAAMRQLAAAQGADLRVRVWRGRGAPNPDGAPEPESGWSQDKVDDLAAIKDKTKMCLRPDDADRVMDAQLRVTPALCVGERKSGGIGEPCPWFDACAYMKQVYSARADIWVVASNLLFQSKPAAIGRPIMNVVDEEFEGRALFGVSGVDSGLPIDRIPLAPDAPQGYSSGLGWQSLNSARVQLELLLQKGETGPLRRADVIEAGFSDPATLRDYAKAEWKRIEGLLADGAALLDPSTKDTATRNLDERRAGNTVAGIFAAMADLVADPDQDASGRIEIAHIGRRGGDLQKVVRLKGHRDVHPGWVAPTLIINATVRPEVTRAFFPEAVVTADIAAEAPFQDVTQVIGRSWSKSSLMEGGKPKEAEIKKLLGFIASKAAAVWPKRALVICQKDIEKALEAYGLPDNIETGHYKAIAGIDTWGDVAALITIGRTLPPVKTVEALAEATTGRTCNRIVPIIGEDGAPRVSYETHDAVRVMRNGDVLSTSRLAHPDPIAEAWRWTICEGEMLQAIGRARGVNRTSENPVSIVVMSDIPLDLPLDSLVQWQDVRPGPYDQMATRGVVMSSPADAVVAHRDLLGSAQAAKKAFQRDKSLGTFPYKDSLLGECPPPPGWKLAAYKKEGAGKREAFALFRPDLIDGAEDWLEANLAPLSSFRWVEYGTIPPDPPAEARGEPQERPAVTETDIPLRMPERVPDGLWHAPDAGPSPSGGFGALRHSGAPPGHPFHGGTGSLPQPPSPSDGRTDWFPDG